MSLITGTTRLTSNGKAIFKERDKVEGTTICSENEHIPDLSLRNQRQRGSGEISKVEKGEEQWEEKQTYIHVYLYEL